MYKKAEVALAGVGAGAAGGALLHLINRCVGYKNKIYQVASAVLENRIT